MSNLPPGVTESMIPGNRPSDAAEEKLIDELYTFLSDRNIGPYEDDGDESNDKFHDLLYEAVGRLTQDWARDAHEVHVRASKCHDCDEILGKGYTYETRTMHVGTDDEYETDVFVHQICPRDREDAEYVAVTWRDDERNTTTVSRLWKNGSLLRQLHERGVVISEQPTP